MFPSLALPQFQLSSTFQFRSGLALLVTGWRLVCLFCCHRSYLDFLVVAGLLQLSRLAISHTSAASATGRTLSRISHFPEGHLPASLSKTCFGAATPSMGQREMDSYTMELQLLLPRQTHGFHCDFSRCSQLVSSNKAGLPSPHVWPIFCKQIKTSAARTFVPHYTKPPISIFFSFPPIASLGMRQSP